MEGQDGCGIVWHSMVRVLGRGPVVGCRAPLSVCVCVCVCERERERERGRERERESDKMINLQWTIIGPFFGLCSLPTLLWKARMGVA